MAESIYLEATPVRLLSEVFRLYQYFVADLNRSPGIIVEDGCTEFMFVKQPDIRLKIDGLDPVYVPRAFSAGKFTRPFKYEYRGEMNYFAVKLQPWTARHFIPEVLNGLIDLSTIYGPEIQDLSDEIFECASFEKMVQTSEDFFSKGALQKRRVVRQQRGGTVAKATTTNPGSDVIARQSEYRNSSVSWARESFLPRSRFWRPQQNLKLIAIQTA